MPEHSPSPSVEGPEVPDAELDASHTDASSGGVARPAFARDFPRVPELDAIVLAFGRGDYAAVRKGADALQGFTDPAVKAAARDLRDRTSADPIAIWILVGTGLLLGLLTLYWSFHNGGP